MTSTPFPLSHPSRSEPATLALERLGLPWQGAAGRRALAMLIGNLKEEHWVRYRGNVFISHEAVAALRQLDPSVLRLSAEWSPRDAFRQIGLKDDF